VDGRVCVARVPFGAQATILWQQAKAILPLFSRAMVASITTGISAVRDVSGAAGRKKMRDALKDCYPPDIGANLAVPHTATRSPHVHIAWRVRFVTADSGRRKAFRRSYAFTSLPYTAHMALKPGWRPEPTPTTHR